MFRRRFLATCLCCGALLTGCASGPDVPPEPEPRGTTILRYHRERVTVEDLAANREGALACARMIALLERELQEPWAESRDARILMQHARAKDPTAASIAISAWESAEARAAGSDRGLFEEFGIYGTRRMPGPILRRAEPESPEGYAARLLASARGEDPADRLLSGWRHLAPEVSQRGPNYLASAWRFNLGMDSIISLQDSLLGPFARCTVVDAGSVSGQGPLDGLDAFQMPREILDLLLPAEPCQLVTLIESLVGGGALPRTFRLAPGPVEQPDSESSEFLAAALRGLRDGICLHEHLPSGVTGFQVTFSYLLGTSEARAGIGLKREGLSSWVVESFHYEPAGASLMGQRGARLDLMPLLRARHRT